MPKALENKLKQEAATKGLTGNKANAYVYGTMRKTGWKPKQQMAPPMPAPVPTISTRG